MAITRATFSKIAGWTNSEVINQLEEAFEFAGLHGGAVTGLAAGPGYIPDPNTAGGTVGTSNATYSDIEPIATSGSGIGATFNISRSSGTMSFVRVNRPGSGYIDGDTVTISADDIGGSANGATDVTFPIFVATNVTGAQTYNFSYTGNFILSGTDRLGSFSNVARATSQVITVMEGDTLVFTNDTGWQLYILAVNNRFGNTNIPLSPLGVENWGSTSGTITWLTMPTQAGTYFLSTQSGNSSPINHDIVVLPRDNSRTFTPRSYGSSSDFFDKQSDPGSVFPWGCLRQVTQAGKKYGDTYRTFQVSSQNRLDFAVGSSFMPELSVANSFSRRFKGSRYLDLSNYLDTENAVSFSNTFLWSYNRNTVPTVSQLPGFVQAGGGSARTELESICSLNAGNSFSLDLNVYRSALDPNFAVFSYKQPNLSSTDIKSNSFLTFFLHNFTNSIWDLDSVFLSGFTSILSSGGNTTQPEVTFRTYCAGSLDFNGAWAPSIRAAECGYLPMGGSPNTDIGSQFTLSHRGYKDSVYRATSFPQGTAGDGESIRESNLYYRTNTISDPTQARGLGMPDESNFNAIIRGIPLNTTLVPVPYYLPDDFVLVQFDNATPALNVQQGDTLVVEDGVEEYVIITGSYNQTLRTRGILFCARIV
jgi:hypothetical protein